MARLCAICERNEVTSKNPECDFCETCFYTGASHEREYAPILARLSAVEGVEGDAVVWHTGGGCFNVALRLSDGRFLTPSIAVEDDHGVWPEPGLPNAAKGERWSFVLSRSEQAWSEWVEDEIVVVQIAYTDDELVAAVEKVVGLSFDDVRNGKLAEAS